MSDQLYYKSGLELASLLAEKKISSTELTQAFINRTKATEPTINAFISSNEEYTLQQAKDSDTRRSQGKSLSPIDGLCISLKDIICELNQPLTCASKILQNYISPYDATTTQKLKNAGAVLWGRLNLDEFAMGSSTETSFFKKTSNPWNPQHTPGGSSGGSAAAVAAGQTIMALGTDTGGSIRQPASHCGIVGLKPTYGRVSRYGLAAFASSLDQIGPLTRTVADAALFLQYFAGHDPFDSTSAPLPLPDFQKSLSKKLPWKLGIPKEYFTEGMGSDVRQAVESAIQFYQKQGCQIIPISLPNSSLAIPTYYVLATAEASSNLARYDGIRYTYRTPNPSNAIDIFSKSRGEGFGSEVKRRIILGTYVLSSGFYDAYYLRAQKVRNLIRLDFENAFKQVDAILTPTVPNPAFKTGEKNSDPLAMYLEDICTVSINLAGLPGISLPCGFSKNNLPIGLQIIGKPYDEENILSIAYQFEQAHNFHNQHPNL